MIGECIRFAQYFWGISIQVTRGMSGNITTKGSESFCTPVSLSTGLLVVGRGAAFGSHLSAPTEVLAAPTQLLFVGAAPLKKLVSRDGLGVLLVVAILRHFSSSSLWLSCRSHPKRSGGADLKMASSSATSRRRVFKLWRVFFLLS